MKIRSHFARIGGQKRKLISQDLHQPIIRDNIYLHERTNFASSVTTQLKCSQEHEKFEEGRI
jgi:hypothetical protein